jgi:hypothetical protein
MGGQLSDVEVPILVQFGRVYQSSQVRSFVRKSIDQHSIEFITIESKSSHTTCCLRLVFALGLMGAEANSKGRNSPKDTNIHRRLPDKLIPSSIKIQVLSLKTKRNPQWCNG